MTDFVHRSVDRAVGTITISRPEVHNAFDEVVIEELTSAFTDMGASSDVRAIILRSEGKSFCAGADVHWMKRMVAYSYDENIADARAMAVMLRTIHDCPKPVIARVHGACIGGGVGLMAACDIAVAIESAVFSLSEVKLGIVPAVISPYVMEKIGSGAMHRYALTAERFDANEAKRLGLASDVVSDVDALDEWINRTLRRILRNGPEAVSACKAILRDVHACDWDRATDLTTAAIAERRVSAEGQEGLKAFLEKREPDWT